VRRGAGRALLPAAILAEHAPPLVGLADLPHRSFADFVAGCGDLVEETPVAEFGVLAVRVDGRVRQGGLLVLAVGDRGSRARRSSAGDEA